MELKTGWEATPGPSGTPEGAAEWLTEADPREWELEVLLNAPVLQSLMEDYAKLTFTVTAILDLKGKVLVAVGWQDICTQFHRVNAASCQNCIQSDLYLAGHVERGEYVAYKCKNGLWDVVTPLYVADRHMGNIYTGQFFYDDEVIDRQAFEAQAEAFGYDKTAYLAALDRVPRFSRDQVKRLMDFLVKFTDLVSRFTLSNIRSAEYIREQSRSALALRKSEAALRESRAMLAQILDTIPQSVFWKDPEGRYLGCNKPFSEAAGLEDPAQVIGKTDFDLPWTREEAEAYRADDRQVMESRRPKLRILESLQKADGTRLQIETSKAPLLDGNGHPFAVLGIYEDITERKRTEEEREKLQAQLRQSQKMEGLGNLAGGVAHDMNNVLGAILGLATAHLDAQLPDSPVHKAFEIIIKAAERGGKMVKSLLSFSRQTAFEERQLDLNKIIQEEVTLLERTTLAKVHLEMNLAGDLRPIRGDESALTHAILNLCLNAVDAMPDNGTITLRTQNLGDHWVEVQVEDTGVGMPKEVLDRAMDPFFTTKGVGGTGLGLSLVYSTLKAHQGHIDIQSEAGRGTCVRLRFPACAIEAQALKPSVSIAAPGPQKALRVLLVDDDELIQIATRMILETLGHSVNAAQSGEEALAKLEAGFEPDLVILDMNMPGLGGTGTLPQLRVLRPAVPILLATGRTDQTALNLASTFAGVTLFPKPFGLRELQKYLETLALGSEPTAQSL